jgi:formylglycine-generating enzyme required for sulfatase activity
VSNVGAFDLVGNVLEWVADWEPRSTTCGSWGTFSDDMQCLAGADARPITPPGALLRGGSFLFGTNAGVFTVDGTHQPSLALFGVGFRCGR